MSNLSWLRVRDGRHVRVLRIEGDQVLVSIGGAREVMSLAAYRALPPV
jgi:hypothetical protein